MNDLERALRRAAGRGFGEAADQASRSLVSRAASEGLLDVAYATVDSPLGPLVAAATPRGLVRLAHSDVDAVLEELAEDISPRVLEDRRRLEDVLRELDEYFAGRRRTFDVPLDRSLSRGFKHRVLRALEGVPYGRLVTYGGLARQLRRPRAARAVGNALASNPIPIVVPCHRVVRAGGVLGNYGWGPERKEWLLRLEGALGD